MKTGTITKGRETLTTEKKAEENKPSFADKKTWAAYLVLEAVAKDREYREIGVSLASNLVGGTLGLTKRTTTSVRDITPPVRQSPL